MSKAPVPVPVSVLSRFVARASSGLLSAPSVRTSPPALALGTRIGLPNPESGRLFCSYLSGPDPAAAIRLATQP